MQSGTVEPPVLGGRTEKRDARREVKALKAAKVESAIEAELLSRLKQGTYGDIYNFDQRVYEKVLQAAEVRPPITLLAAAPLSLPWCTKCSLALRLATLPRLNKHLNNF